MKNIRIGACDWALPGNGLYATQIAADVGLDCISIKLGTSDHDYPLTQKTMQEIYLDEQQRYGIGYCAVALNDLDNIPMHAKEGTKEHGIVWDMLRRSVPTAKKLGVSVIQVPAFVASEIRTEKEMERSADAFRWLCDAAGEADLMVATENDMEPERFKQFFEMVQRENFYLYFDSQNYHQKKGIDPIVILENLYPYMCNQLHVKDGVELSGGLLGSGPSNFYRTMNWLDQHYYSGYILLENYYDESPLRDQADDPYELLREDIRILREAIAKPHAACREQASAS